MRVHYRRFGIPYRSHLQGSRSPCLFITDVSGHRIGPIFKGQDIHEGISFSSNIPLRQEDVPKRLQQTTLWRCGTSQKIEDLQRHILVKTGAACNQSQRTVGLGASRYGRDYNTGSFRYYRHKPYRTLPTVALRKTRALSVHIDTTMFATAVSPVWSTVTNSRIPCKRILAVNAKVIFPFFSRHVHVMKAF